MNRLNRELTNLCDSISLQIAPHSVDKPIWKVDKLDRIVSQLKTLKMRIEICCTSAVNMCSSLYESKKIKALIQAKNKLCLSAKDVQVLDGYSVALCNCFNVTFKVMLIDLVFVLIRKLPAKNTGILQKYRDLGSVLIADSLVNAAGSIFGTVTRDE